MRIYVAGLFEQGSTVIREAMDALRERGHTITHDWTVEPSHDQRACARKDCDGVKSADVVIAFMTDPKATYRGTCTILFQLQYAGDVMTLEAGLTIPE